jgi:hypothetical protein
VKPTITSKRGAHEEGVGQRGMWSMIDAKMECALQDEVLTRASFMGSTWLQARQQGCLVADVSQKGQAFSRRVQTRLVCLRMVEYHMKKTW